MRTLAVIPARSGSKGLKDKNILPLCGKPLLSYTIEAALKSQCFDTVMVSTDALEYAEIAAACGAEVPFLRSKAAATDQASSWEVVLEVLQKYEEKGRQFDFVMLLQPTSPLRNEQEIRNAFSVQERNHAEAVVSVCEMEHSPLWCNTLPENHCMDHFISSASRPRQQLGRYYRINGALYLVHVEKLRRDGTLIYDKATFAYLMDKDQSVDIDDATDFMLAEFLMKTQGNRYP